MRAPKSGFRVVDRLLALTGARPRIAVAFSGGLDSTVLAHALMMARGRLAHLRLIHIDHRLQPASADWAERCARQARRWRVPITVLRATIPKHRGESPEAAAREARYMLFEEALEPGEVVVTAQHEDDQAETLLLQLFRGAGVAGLAAMPPIAPFGRGRLARPLLGVPRAALVRHADAHQLEWIEDPTNLDTRFTRNFLRHDVLPVIRRKWPAIDGTLARVASHMADAQGVLEGSAGRDLARAMDGAGLNVATLRTLPEAQRRHALRAFIVRAGLAAPATATLREISDTLLAVRVDAQPEVRWPGAILRRRAGRLELEVISELARSRTTESASKSWDWSRHRELMINSSGDRLVLIDDSSGPIDLDRLPPTLELRARVGGESLRPGPRARTRPLKKILQDARVAVEDRARLPLLFAGENPKGILLAVGERWIDASIAANVKSRRRARLRWRRA